MRRASKEDVASGVESDVTETLTFFINCVRHDDLYDFETLLSAIEDAGAAAYDEREVRAKRASASDGGNLRES